MLKLFCSLPGVRGRVVEGRQFAAAAMVESHAEVLTFLGGLLMVFVVSAARSLCWLFVSTAPQLQRVTDCAVPCS